MRSWAKALALVVVGACAPASDAPAADTDPIVGATHRQRKEIFFIVLDSPHSVG